MENSFLFRKSGVTRGGGGIQETRKGAKKRKNGLKERERETFLESGLIGVQHELNREWKELFITLLFCGTRYHFAACIPFSYNGTIHSMRGDYYCL